MNVKRSLAALLAVTMLASVFVAGPAAAMEGDECTQSNSQLNALNVNTDANVNAVNAAANAPVLSPNTGDGDQSATAVQSISDGGDDFQSQSNEC